MSFLSSQANIMKFNEESLRKMDDSSYTHPDLKTFKLPDTSTDTSADGKSDFDQQRSLSLTVKDLEMPMPPLALAPLREDSIR